MYRLMSWLEWIDLNHAEPNQIVTEAANLRFFTPGVSDDGSG